MGRKAILEKRMKRLEAKKTALVERAKASQDVNEVRSINEELTDLNAEIEETREEITAIEAELNMQLFIRSKKKVRLTPAGAVLLRELPALEEHYEDIVRKAKIAHEGNAGELTIGILEGQMLGSDMVNLFGEFEKEGKIKFYGEQQ